MSDGDIFVPVVGKPLNRFRAWRIEECPENGALSLSSIHYRTTWPGGGSYLAAECRGIVKAKAASERDSHSAPDPDHTCGIYAVAEVEQCRDWVQRADFPKKLAAIGEVALWGKVWRCTNGVRAQYAIPLWIRVLVPSDSEYDPREAAEILRGIYRVPTYPAPPPW